MEEIDEKFMKIKNSISNLNELKLFDFFECFLFGYIVGKYNYKLNSCIDMLQLLCEYRNNKDKDEFILDLAQSHLFNGFPNEACLLILPQNKIIQMPLIDNHNENIKNKEEKEEKEEEKSTNLLKKSSSNSDKDSLINSLKLSIKKSNEDAKAKEKKIKELEKASKSKCAICQDEINDLQDLFPLFNCNDVFHGSCFKQYLESRIKDHLYPITCPNISCKEGVSNYDMNQLLGEETLNEFYITSFQKHVEINMNLYSNCPTPDCVYIFIFDYQNGPQFTCPKCAKQYCLDCKSEFHTGMTCNEYRITHNKTENDAKFEEFVIGQKYKQCPGCTTWVSKIEGCDFISCRCGKQFCYNCGGEKDKCNCASKAGGHFK